MRSAPASVKGTRVSSIVEELGGEKIDVIKYSDDPEELIAAALSPAVVSQVLIDPAGTKSCRAIVPDSQLSLAIGNKGRTSSGCASDWLKIDIGPESQAEQIMEEYEQAQAGSSAAD